MTIGLFLSFLKPHKREVIGILTRDQKWGAKHMWHIPLVLKYIYVKNLLGKNNHVLKVVFSGL